MARVIINLTLVAALVASAPAGAADPDALIPSGTRILFLGDSNTFAGHYVVFLEAALRRADPERKLELINIGLPSETACGLSEPDHPFPRPNVHERLDRALEKIKPDLVVACYGTNDGIYYPFGEERFATYQKGITTLVEKVKKAGAKVVLVTPPPFDPLPMKRRGKLRAADAEKFAWFGIYENYDDEVLARYAEWILTQKDHADLVIDVRTPTLSYFAQQRAKDPNFVMSGDGIHFNQQGHRIMAAALLKAWGMDAELDVPPALIKLVAKKQFLMRDAWLSHVGHKRPGVRAALPLEEAQKKAAAIDVETLKLGRSP